MREANGDDETDPLTGGGPPAAAQSGAHRLMKALGNVCFSLFVLSVLVVTVVAITYQPPDPWLDTSKALTRSFSDTLNASTFRPDDSLLPTAEDQSPPLLLSEPNSTASLLPPAPPAAEAPSCQPSAFNCSDPGVLAAIVKLNSKIFKSIVFIAYEVPVPGAKPFECDVAWSFRNRKEKSWRRYRDYRRFRLAPDDNCTYTVTRTGKFRSGTNAAARRTRPAPNRSVAPLKDADINDTIPVVGSEEFKRGKYLYYSRGGDYCKGVNQYIWSFLCGLGEAQFLNRTFVMDLNMCIPAEYNPSNMAEQGKDFRNYFDFEHLKMSVPVVEEGEFLHDWGIWDRKSRGKKAVTVRKVPTYKVTPMQLRRDRSTILWRQFNGPEPENYWYRVCEGKAAKYVQRPWNAIWKSKRLMNIVTEIGARMDWDYDAVHVVRGGKAANKKLWPNLDADTSPDALVSKLLKMVKEQRKLYVATNEPFYNYFDKLRSHYKVHLLDDYNDLWGNKSEWYNATSALNDGKPVQFDGYMRVAVDTEVLYRAKTRVETFNNLTSDCKDGINTC